MRRAGFETAEGAEISNAHLNRAQIEPFTSDLPGMPGTIMLEAPCMVLISVPHEGQDLPAFAIGMPGDEGDAVAFFYTLGAPVMRTLAFQLLQLADKADSGAGKQ